jgi:hypothetical protein
VTRIGSAGVGDALPKHVEIDSPMPPSHYKPWSAYPGHPLLPMAAYIALYRAELKLHGSISAYVPLHLHADAVGRIRNP